MTLQQGTRLGGYEIVAAIGSGGMGEVYRARDTRLDRDVAIKVLARALARDPVALARFEREAMSVAKLSHANILAIYEFARTADDETAYVVTELVDGETLRARLSNGPLLARRAVGYAQQIARGIAAAHARRIVHRDLKPENVMITRDDQVKILDFGLAKPIEAGSGDETRAAIVNTSAGTVLGTFAYMAPEQVRGLDVDHRADIFAFGALLYEMLSGERAFKGETAADTMTAILTKEPPDLDMAKLAIAPALERIVRRCLEKSPDLRFQSANDLAFALETLSTASATSSGSSLPVASVTGGGRVAWLPWAIAAAAAAAAIAIWLLRSPAPADPMWEHFSQLTDAAGEETSPSMSPNGTTVAYVMRRNGRRGIYAQRVGGRNATPIVVDPDHDLGGPAYSPDGASLAYHQSDSDGGIFLAGATGESARRLTDVGFNPAWSPDGKTIAFTTEEVLLPASRNSESHLFVVDATGGTPRLLTPDTDAIQASWSPSGQRIVYWSNTNGQRDIYTIAAAGGPRSAVTNDAALDWSPQWSADSYVYFASDRGGAMNLWRVRVNERTGAVSGQPQPVTNGVQAAAGWERFSGDGTQMVFQSTVRSINPLAIPFDPASARAGVPVVLDGSNNIRVPSDVSPDGHELALFAIGDRQEDLFIASTDGTRIRRVTDDPARDRAPVFTRDGKGLLYYSNRNGGWAIWLIRTDGSGLRELATSPKTLLYPLTSPVADEFVYSIIGGGVFRTSLTGNAPTSQQLPNTTTNNASLTPTTWSLDGSRLAGPLSGPTGSPAGVGVYDLGAQSLTVVSPDATSGVRWLPDNRRLLYFTQPESKLVMLDSVNRQRTVIPVQLPARVIDDVFALSRDGRTIYVGAVHMESDIWIAQR